MVGPWVVGMFISGPSSTVVEMKNSIVSDNGWGQNPYDNCAFYGQAALQSLGFNIDSRRACALSGPGDLDSTNPMLDSAVPWPLAGGPALDGGDPAGCTERHPGNPAEISMLTDVRGNPYDRHQDGDGSGRAECDRGAYEADGKAVCGNGVVEGLEVCDDGNQRDGDGCSASCASERCTGPRGCDHMVVSA